MLVPGRTTPAYESALSAVPCQLKYGVSFLDIWHNVWEPTKVQTLSHTHD